MWIGLKNPSNKHICKEREKKNQAITICSEIILYIRWEINENDTKYDLKAQKGFFKILFIFFFRKKGKEGERVGEKYQCMVASSAPPTGDLAHNPGMCPEWESNWWPFGSQDGSQIHWATPARAWNSKL